MKLPKDPLSDVIEGGVKGLLDSGADLLDRFIMSKEEKSKAKTEWVNMLQAHEIALQEAAAEQERIAAQDRDSARKMQITALQQKDWLSRNFIYLLAFITIFGAIVFVIALFVYEIPESNRRLIEMAADLFVFAAAIQIYNFFFGSSSGSKQKTDLLGGVPKMENPPPPPAPNDIDATFTTERQKRKSERRKLAE